VKDKVYLITGASGAIGGATAKELEKEGAKLILVGRSIESLNRFIEIELTQSYHVAVAMDLEAIDLIADKIKTLAKSYGKIDGFVHAAGLGDVRPLKMTTPSFLLKILTVNFISFIEIIRAISSPSVRNEALRIVGVSATGAFLGNSTKTAYCASKAAMNASVRCLAKELSNKNVRINTVAPGATYSKMMDDILDLPGGEETLSKITERQFLGVCKPKDIADGILFLLSDESRMISGTCLPIDGGKLAI
jgi:NAD(P)-dependent dehydrogenase (short-subunit alcohol dehydrogenase family)